LNISMVAKGLTPIFPHHCCKHQTHVATGLYAAW